MNESTENIATLTVEEEYPEEDRETTIQLAVEESIRIINLMRGFNGEKSATEIICLLVADVTEKVVDVTEEEIDEAIRRLHGYAKSDVGMYASYRDALGKLCRLCDCALDPNDLPVAELLDELRVGAGILEHIDEEMAA
jgi:hypothetical protein